MTVIVDTKVPVTYDINHLKVVIEEKGEPNEVFDDGEQILVYKDETLVTDEGKKSLLLGKIGISNIQPGLKLKSLQEYTDSMIKIHDKINKGKLNEAKKPLENLMNTKIEFLEQSQELRLLYATLEAVGF